MVYLVFPVTLCVTLLHLSTDLTTASNEQGDDHHMTADPAHYQLSQTLNSTQQSLLQMIHAALLSKEYLGQAPLSGATIGATPGPTQTALPLHQYEPSPADMSPEALATARGDVMTSVPAEEETRTSLITTTTVTTVQTPVQCGASFSGMEGTIESPDSHSSSSTFPPSLECTYSITVYPGYGVEIQVKRVSLSKEETLTILGLGGTGPELLANETFMKEDLVIRSSTNQVQIQYGCPKPAFSPHNTAFSLHYQAFLLSCPFPLSPEGGGVTVTGLHPGGHAHFHCDPGFQLKGHAVISCLNSTKPHWSSPTPQCVAASCGGWIRNATVGQIFYHPRSTAGNHSSSYSNLSCVWLLEAKERNRLHLHFQSFVLDEDYSRLTVRSGSDSASPLVFDSDLDDVPEQGVISLGPSLYLDLSLDTLSVPLLLVLRYEAYDGDHCYEPFLAHGNYSSSDITFSLGTVVSFSCSPGFIMEQGSGVIECIDPRDPHWNESEPVCRALCGGELTTPTGVVLSPDWPQSYSKGQDCIWLIHVSEEKRIELDVQVLNIRHNDILTVYNGHDLMSPVIGEYQGPREHFKVVSEGSEVTIQFQTDPEDSSFVLTQGFTIHYHEVERSDTCSALPPIEFGWKRSSHPSFVKGSVLTYQCQPGYHIVGSNILICQWNLSWSNSPPTCQKTTEARQCSDPGDVVNGARSVYPNTAFAVATVVRFSCNQNYQLEGPAQIYCQDDGLTGPTWSDKIPKCVLKYDPCPNPGIPHNGYQTFNKSSYRAGESLHFFCFEGYELIGEVTITCLPGHPAQWNNPPPICKAAYEELLDGPKQENCRNLHVLCHLLQETMEASLQEGLSHRHTYGPIAVKTDSSSSVYEAVDTREYEVSI
ncbi:hypothetical protein AGOR_G00228810 [Albula goreensis]|uniref:Uncharacterized protein n=1 Tax=Albula goreensis TaxID=1534307 RepID=A0A8T3CLG6_9TELE|nr:hypothetical protein AGOR_G00228810 [Albula goreensis]